MTPITFTDRFEIDDKATVRKTKEGYLVAKPRVARTGIQIYRGREVDPDNEHGLRDQAEVRVYRPEASVFSRDSLASFAHRPITDDHPGEPLTADNWADHSIGNMGEEIVRDGEFVRVGTLIMDAGAIAKIDAGKAELSVGYTAELDFTPGKTTDGLQYDAIQGHIRVNHLALVGHARGGHDLRIGDQEAMATRTFQIDGITFTADEQIASLCEKLARDLADAKTAAATAKTDADTRVGTLTAQVATLTAEVATLKDAASKNVITPAMIDERVKAKMQVAADAKRVMGAEFTTDGKEPDAIKKEVVLAKLADAAKDFNADSINAAFTTLVASAPKTEDGTTTTTDVLRDGIRQQVPTAGQAAADKAWQERALADENAWKPKAA